MKHTGIFTILILCATMIFGGIFGKYEVRSRVPQRIIDSVIAVQGSSGIIVYSESDYSLVLTSYHVVESEVDEFGLFKEEGGTIDVAFIYFKEIDGETKVWADAFEVNQVIVNPELDLALIEIVPNYTMGYVMISTTDPELAEDVFLAGNPNQNYRVITRGIVSSKDRYLPDKGHVWQLSGGATFGLSGGGAFNIDGQLVGVARAVDNGPAGIGSTCTRIPIEYIGYFVPLYEVKEFLLSTEFRENFSYLER